MSLDYERVKSLRKSLEEIFKYDEQPNGMGQDNHKSMVSNMRRISAEALDQDEKETLSRVVTALKHTRADGDPKRLSDLCHSAADVIEQLMMSLNYGVKAGP